MESKIRPFGLKSLVLIGLLSASLVMTGCSGDDGSDGTDGADGVAGINGTAGTAGTDGTDGTAGINGINGTDGLDGTNGTNGTDGVDGVDGVDGSDAVVNLQTLADLGLVYADNVIAINPILDLSRTVAYNAATGAVTVHFFLADEDGKGIDVTKEPYELRLYASELLPGTTPNLGPAWTQLFNESGTPAVAPMAGTLTLVNAATGEYTYVCSNTVADTANVVRVTMRARFRFRDSNNAYVVVANPVNASYDFLLADPATPLAASGADMVTSAACNSCHGNNIGNVGHGGGYTEVKTCNNCHNISYMTTAGHSLDFDLAAMIHGIHSAKVIGEDVTGETADFTEVTYPQEINTCSKCHNGPNADLAFTGVTRHNCGSCHDTVDFAIGTNHDGGAQLNDAGCLFCHAEGGSGKGPIEAHNPAPAAANVPEFDVAITMSAPAAGDFYVAGETPTVTVKLKNHADGSDVDPLFYTTAAGAKGNTTDTALSSASLYVYGPRMESVPVLATDTITDPAYVAPPTQGHKLQTGGGDALATPTADGFTYQLLSIPEGMEAGTYMVRFEGYDYGAISDVDYKTSSTAVINFQVKTSTVEPKLSGDACIDCHGATRMHLEGAHPHNAAFDTDACLGCHDKSGNYGDYIGNRVHAVHRATITGDTHNRDWSEVTFPRPANNCMTCHTSTLDTPVWRTPDMLACGGCHGAMPDAVPASYPAEQQAQVTREVAAAQHMEQNGGSVVPTVTPTLQCLVCHGDGRAADLYDTHQLIKFRPLPVVEP